MFHFLQRHFGIVIFAICVVLAVVYLSDGATNRLAVLSSVIVVVCGWAYNAKIADERETRKELRADIAEINKSIYEIIDLAQQYNPKNETQNVEFFKSRIYLIAKSSALLGSIEQLIGESVFHNHELERQQCKQLATKFWETVCGDNIEDGDTILTNAYDSKQDQYYYGSELSKMLNILFRACFK
ncbi:hypothetical protein [Advenella mimigardefordensis]|uniref:Putative membrane protein n=1 Tax=Advenella mimigardefordensis (strain DSM 17166 / LMG 22922 / DPN7) TaxID=1247726 RepID=W0PHA8_ADVMD|nr:hypothetical protein [Advenella mimigardefordensis]AHG64333.1 putative membrane protein [Advenella mimigardefordensis DPN7]